MSTPLRRFLRSAWRNITVAGLVLSPMVPHEFLRAAFPSHTTDDVPEQEWPERLIPDVELTPDERVLWAQLEELDR